MRQQSEVKVEDVHCYKICQNTRNIVTLKVDVGIFPRFEKHGHGYVSFLISADDVCVCFSSGIRLQPVAMPSTSQEINEIKGVRRLTDGGIGRFGGVVLCKGGECSGTLKRRRTSRAVREAEHRQPGFHADYCGPRSHKNIKEGVETEGTPSQYHSSKEIDGNQDQNKSLKSTASVLPVSRAEDHPDIMDLAAMDYAFSHFIIGHIIA
ncbi:hypothetical protein ACLOJK_002523 [Asimina triloba]